MLLVVVGLLILLGVKVLFCRVRSGLVLMENKVLVILSLILVLLVVLVEVGFWCWLMLMSLVLIGVLL